MSVLGRLHPMVILLGVLAIVLCAFKVAGKEGHIDTTAVSQYLGQGASGSLIVAILSVFVSYSIAYCATLRSAYARTIILISLAVYMCPYYYLVEAFKPLSGWLGIASPIIPMVLRYSPFGIILIYLRLSQMPLRPEAVRNLRLSETSYHFSVLVRNWCLPVLMLSFVFVFCMAFVDPYVVDRIGHQRWVNMGTWIYSDLKQNPAQVVIWGSIIVLAEFLLVGLCMSMGGRSALPNTSAFQDNPLPLSAGDRGFVVVSCVFILLALWPFARVLSNSAAWEMLPQIATSSEEGSDSCRIAAALKFSLWTALVSACISTLLSVTSITARGIISCTSPRGGPGSRFGDLVMLVPLLVPPAVLGKVLPLLVGRNGLNVGPSGTITCSTLVWMFSSVAYFIIHLSCGERFARLYNQILNLQAKKVRFLRFFWLQYSVEPVVIAFVAVFAFAFNESAVNYLVANRDNLGAYLNAALHNGNHGSQLETHYAAAAVLCLLANLAIVAFGTIVVMLIRITNKSRRAS